MARKNVLFFFLLLTPLLSRFSYLGSWAAGTWKEFVRRCGCERYHVLHTPDCRGPALRIPGRGPQEGSAVAFLLQVLSRRSHTGAMTRQDTPGPVSLPISPSFTAQGAWALGGQREGPTVPSGHLMR